MIDFVRSFWARLPLLALAACASSTAPGPHDAPHADRACTDIGCENGLEVAFETSAPLPHGHYAIDVEADGKRGTFEVDLPLPPCDVPSRPTTGDLVFGVGVSGCALPPDEHSLVGVRLSERPAKVRIRVVHSGSVLADATLTPAYRERRPNGPECEPTCVGASESIRLTTP